MSLAIDLFVFFRDRMLIIANSSTSSHLELPEKSFTVIVEQIENKLGKMVSFKTLVGGPGNVMVQCLF